jgi:hypothetical protein
MPERRRVSGLSSGSCPRPDPQQSVQQITKRKRVCVEHAHVNPVCALLPIRPLAHSAAPEWRFCTGQA